MKSVELQRDADLAKIISKDSDYRKAEADLLSKMTFELFLIREFEQTLLKLSVDGCIHGPVHTSIGEESCAVGAMAALKATDKIASTHRAHHHYLAKIFNYYLPSDFDILKDDITSTVRDEITILMGEVMGLSIGCCGGRGGSMHLRNEKTGIIGTNAIVAGGVPLATGAAFASKYNNSNDVVVCFLGDGAVNQGAFHEAVNLAGIWKLPIVYFIENNHYAVATSIKNSTATKDLAAKAIAYGIPGKVVDGMDPLAVMKSTEDAIEYCRSGNGAVILEAKCYRFQHHAGSIDGSNFGYRTKEEEKKWRKLDACEAFPQKLIDLSIFTQKQIEDIKEKAGCVVKNVTEKCATFKDNKFFVKEDLLPDAKTIETGLRGDGSEFEDVKFNEKEDFSEFKEMSYSDAIASVTGRWLEKDEKVFVLGEEIANFGGGPYGATKDLPAKYPDRVLNTPISECGFTGLAGGSAMSGLKPVVEIMFPDFALVAADQLFNQIGKLRHIYGNSTDMPVVIRTRVAIGCGYGGQHSGDPAGIFSLFSGWRVLAPSNAFDYIGLFNSAMQSKDPVLMVEHHQLYSTKFDVPKDSLDYFVQMGKAKVVCPGNDITVLCYSSTVDLCARAVEQLKANGVNTEIIDLRTISPNDIDYETIGNSLKKTGLMIIVEQAPKSQSIGARIVEHCQKYFFDYLDGPIETVSSLDIPNPVSKTLETAVIASIDSVKNKILNILSITN